MVKKREVCTMILQENVSLKHYNSFGIDALARYFGTFKSVEELQNLLTARTPDGVQWTEQKTQASQTILPTHRALSAGLSERAELSERPTLVLGGGSNILFTKDYDGLVLKNEIRGIGKIKEDEEHVYVTVGAGENWHQFVLHCIENDWAGVENLSLIPGNVGASPMQNIGAYGVEIKEVFQELKAFHLQEKINYTFCFKDCEFGYRDSVFKRKYKDQFVILNVTFQLRKKPVFNISYGAIQQELDKMKVKDLSIRAISDAVIRIRSSKLPDPAVIGNAGSFFKNPSVPAHQFEDLRKNFPGLVGYESPDGSFKLAAAWLIEHSGPVNSVSWKGYRRGDAGCHAQQALVLVNYGNAGGDEINALADEIAGNVFEKFGVNLEKEVNII